MLPLVSTATPYGLASWFAFELAPLPPATVIAGKYSESVASARDARRLNPTRLAAITDTTTKRVEARRAKFDTRCLRAMTVGPSRYVPLLPVCPDAMTANKFTGRSLGVGIMKALCAACQLLGDLALNPRNPLDTWLKTQPKGRSSRLETRNTCHHRPQRASRQIDESPLFV